MTASALLHFYYDGFIWKVRETQTRTMLGIEGAGATALASPRFWPAWVRHSLRWAALVIPFGALCAAQLVGRVVPPIERTAKVAEVLPQDPKAQLNYGKALHEAGRIEEAIAKYEFAIARDPSLAEAEFCLGLAWKDLGDLDRALEHYERSFRLDPSGKCESNLAGVLVAKGLRTEARARYEHSLALNPNLQVAHKELGDLLRGSGEYQAAIGHYEAALRIQPDYVEAQQNLSFARSLWATRFRGGFGPVNLGEAISRRMVIHPQSLCRHQRFGMLGAVKTITSMVLISIHPFAYRKFFLITVAFLGLSAVCFADPVLHGPSLYAESHGAGWPIRVSVLPVKSGGDGKAAMVGPYVAHFESADLAERNPSGQVDDGWQDGPLAGRSSNRHPSLCAMREINTAPERLSACAAALLREQAILIRVLGPLDGRPSAGPLLQVRASQTRARKKLLLGRERFLLPRRGESPTIVFVDMEIMRTLASSLAKFSGCILRFGVDRFCLGYRPPQKVPDAVSPVSATSKANLSPQASFALMNYNVRTQARALYVSSGSDLKLANRMIDDQAATSFGFSSDG